MVDDDEALARTIARILAAEQLDVEIASDGVAATALLLAAPFDVVVSDINLPGTNSVDLLRTIRAYDLDLPVILHTGDPTIETAVEAVDLGAMKYLVKPVERDALVATVRRAIGLRRIARLKREALRITGESADNPGDRAGLMSRFERALESMFIVFQPVVDLRKSIVFGYEALLRTREPSLPSPLDVVHAAERLDRVYDLGRRVRAHVGDALPRLPEQNASIFVNIHTSELLDTSLYDGSSSLAEHVDRVVLEVTERMAIDKVQDVKARASVLRFHGFRLAIDDLGCGYAGLTSFVTLEPDIVKLDMSLVRGVDESRIKQQLIRSVVDLCQQLGMLVVAEGIETRAELQIIRKLGCDLAQGYYIGRPNEAFLTIDQLRV